MKGWCELVRPQATLAHFMIWSGVCDLVILCTSGKIIGAGSPNDLGRVVRPTLVVVPRVHSLVTDSHVCYESAFERWGWELNLFSAGLLCQTDAYNSTDEASCVPLDVFPLLSQTMVIVFMLHFGFSIQGGAHVGNLLGANKPRRAKAATMVPNQIFVSFWDYALIDV